METFGRSKKIFSQANIYTVVCLLFFLRRILFGSFSFMGRGLVARFFLLSLYVSLLALQGTNMMWERGTDRFYYLTIHLQSILPIYSFYYFAKKQLIDDNWFRIVVIFYFVSAFISFRSAQVIKLDRSGDEETVLNESYGFLALFPIMVFFQKKPIIQYVGLFLILFFLLSGFKRGAILLGGICFLVFLWQSLRSTKGLRKIITIVIAGVLLYVVAQYVENLLLNSDLFNMRIEKTLEGNSSGRDDIYSEYWSFFWNQDNVFAIMFGNGAFGTLKHLGLIAHDD